MAKRDFFHTGLQVSRSDLEDIGLKWRYPGGIWYVSRNRGSISGDGRSWDQAYLTIGEAIAAVNLAYSTAAYPTRGRNTLILIDEGWYSEVPLVLTAFDCHIKAVAPGNHDSTVLYGSATAGGFDITSTGPALSLRGSNCTIEGLGMFTYDVLHPSLRIGANASDPDGPVVSQVVGNAIINCGFVRDVADGSLGGILDYGGDGTLIDGCFFSTSCKDYGIRIASNGVTNPVNTRVVRSTFIGCPTGIQQDAGHNLVAMYNDFSDDTSDRADTSDTPIVINGTGRANENYAQGVVSAAITTGTGTISELRNWGDS